jgi:(1->4)-alpha-D-glucan 1-alpha-D-glucosylmutase
MTIPRATARLQFHKDFTLDDAIGVVDYYAELGISHLYASPLLTARAGSTHGYDIVDPTRINPELGGEEALRRLVARLRQAGMGLIADIVPNHMGVGPENAWWQHVLEWGPHSRYAHWFDIDWQSPDPALHGKALLPFLGEPYAETLQSGDLTLRFDADGGSLYVSYHAHRFPLTPTSYAQVLDGATDALALAASAFGGIHPEHPDAERMHADACALLRDIGRSADGRAAIDAALSRMSPQTPRGVQALHRVLEQQNYRLTWWRNAAEEINWRRFFEVSDLAGVRVEQEDVFDATHALIFRLYAEDLIDGVRVDHVDGLADPGAYCRRLRARLQALSVQRPAQLAASPPYIVVEKILAGGEQLRKEWEVDGTTGYEFMDQVGALLHDPAGAEPLAALWTGLTGDADDFHAHVKAARRQLLNENLVGEFEALARALHAVARCELATRDIPLAAIRRVLAELLVAFPVYRTYVDKDGRSALDQQVVDAALVAAEACTREADRPLLTALAQWLGGDTPGEITSARARTLRMRAITRFQQLTPPLAAKAMEDTAFYRYGPLLSRNEVGADPAQFSMSIQDFHDANAARARDFPHTLLATATHDHKRGEDVRARLAVLSEMPEEWGQSVQRWMRLHAPLHVDLGADDGQPLYVPQPADELMLYQMLVGAWPFELSAQDAGGMRAFAERIAAWQEKALREAKRQSSWALPDVRYEQACREFALALLDGETSKVFIDELSVWVARLEKPGIVNSLTQTLLRLTSPGVPDLYQGAEFWDFSLVDPDNRRPVDYAARKQALSHNASLTETASLRQGLLKQQLIHAALSLRAREPALFEHGDYVPVETAGPLAGHVVAFTRRHAGRSALVVALRLPAHIVGPDLMLSQSDGGDTRLVLSEGSAVRWTNVMSGDVLDRGDGFPRLADVLGSLPFALFTDSGG